MPRVLIVVPARLESSRLPRKMLLAETGKPLLAHTLEAAARATGAEAVVAAVDDELLAETVRAAGGTVIMTSTHCASGTDRVAEVARNRPEFDIFVNVQGDEPEMDPAAIDAVIDAIVGDPSVNMATVAVPLRNETDLLDPACVKVILDQAGDAIYFSRAVIPYPREPNPGHLTADPPVYLQHLGLYAYRRDFLLKLTSMPVCRLELIERLEQLRVLDAGHKIRVAVSAKANRGIDTPADYEAFVARHRAASRP